MSMDRWKRSRYTVAFRSGSGDILLHNSFMGALARVPAERFEEAEAAALEGGVSPALKELCDNGFYFRESFDERAWAEGILERESQDRFQDLIILPHEDCNFRCVYCYETHARGSMEPWVAAGLKRYVAERTKCCSALNVRWFGGEPLLAEDLILELSDAFMASCEEQGIPYGSHMTTNAFLLRPPVFERLLQRRVRGYQITLDGPAEAHDTTRVLAGGGPTFETIYRNLLDMRANDRDFQVSVRVNFNDESLGLMEGFFERVTTDFGKDPRFGIYFRPIGKYGGPNDEHLQVCDPGRAKILEMDLAQDFAKGGRLDGLVMKGLQAHGQVCYAAKPNSMVVGSDGTLYKCSVAFENPDNQVGKLNPDGTLDIDPRRWGLWVGTAHLDRGACDSCPIFPLCQSKYCPRSSIQAGKPVCPMTRATYTQLIHLVAGGGPALP